MKSLSKSTWIMFLFDLITLLLSTCLLSNFFNYTYKAICLLTFLVVTVGLTVLYMKGNYRIREFNVNFKNIYLLFEGIVMTHVLPSLYLAIFAASKVNSARFIAVNIFTIFIALMLYRMFFHIYLFKLKKVKNIIVRQLKCKKSDTKCKYFNFAFC